MEVFHFFLPVMVSGNDLYHNKKKLLFKTQSTFTGGAKRI